MVVINSVVLAAGIIAIAAAIWRAGTMVLRFTRRFDQFMDEHELLLSTTKDNSAAILKLNRRLDRMDSGNG
jgi:hypothetical protein